MVFRKRILLLYLVLFVFGVLLVSAFSETQSHQRKQSIDGRRIKRRMLGLETESADKEEQVKPKKKTNLQLLSSSSTKNQTKPTTNSTKKSSFNSTKPLTITLPKTLVLKKLNSTSNSSKNTTKSSSDLSKPTSQSSPKNKTQVPITKKTSQSLPTDKKTTETKPKSSEQTKPKPQKPKIPNWMDLDDTELEDLVSEFRDLPSKFHQNVIPDLERISTTSKAYIFKANKEITEGFKPYVGNKYASTIASITSCIFIIVPLVLVSLIFTRIKAYFSIQKLLIFIQIYLSIYFSILCLASLVTGLEPLKFLYATSQNSYVCLQLLQTLGYVLYLLLLLMYLVLVFSTEVGLGSRMLGLGQTIVGFSVGLHYYVTVFHRAVLHQAPKTNWKVHGIYATCFFVVCAFAGAERRKKAYLEDGGDEGKKS